MAVGEQRKHPELIAIFRILRLHGPDTHRKGSKN